MENVVRDVISQFSKPEIVSISKELQVDATGKSSIVLIEECIKKIKHLLENEEVDLSDLSFEFAITAEIIDENGNELEGKEIKQETIETNVPANAPECYTYAAANVADPSCKKCRVLVECQARRITRRPKCFGNPKLYNPKDVECEHCLENIDNFCGNAIKE